MNMNQIVYSGEFDAFQEGLDGSVSGYNRSIDTSEMLDFVKRVGGFFYHNLLTIGVYASFFAVMICAILLILNGRNRVKLGESKSRVVRVFIVSILIFSVTGLVQIFVDLRLKW